MEVGEVDKDSKLLPGESVAEAAARQHQELADTLLNMPEFQKAAAEALLKSKRGEGLKDPTFVRSGRVHQFSTDAETLSVEITDIGVKPYHVSEVRRKKVTDVYTLIKPEGWEDRTQVHTIVNGEPQNNNPLAIERVSQLIASLKPLPVAAQ